MTDSGELHSTGLLMLIVRRAKTSAKIPAKKFGEKGRYEPAAGGLTNHIGPARWYYLARAERHRSDL